MDQIVCSLLLEYLQDLLSVNSCMFIIANSVILVRMTICVYYASLSEISLDWNNDIFYTLYGFYINMFIDYHIW